MVIYISVVFSSFIFSLLELFTSLRKEKFFKIIQFLFILILFILYAFNRGNTDYENYVKIFNGEMEVHDKGYIFLSDIIKSLGGTYNYVPLVAGFFLIIYFFYFYKTDYTITFIFLYFMLSFIFDFNQIRNTLCSGFLLIGLLYLNKNRKIVYLIFNIIAIFFQRFGLLILLFFVLNGYDLKKYKKIVFIALILGFCLMNFFPYILNNFFPDKAYYLEKKTHLSPLAYAIYLSINLIILKLMETKEKLKEEDMYKKMILFPIIFLPTSLYFLEILARIVKFSNNIKWFYFLKYTRKKKNLKKVSIIFILLILQEAFLWAVGVYNNPEHRLGMIEKISKIGFYF